MKRIIKNNLLGFILGLFVMGMGLTVFAIINVSDIKYKDTVDESSWLDAGTAANARGVRPTITVLKTNLYE